MEANQVMQEPLEKLYQYENQPDIREKIREYISELDTKIQRIKQCINDNGDDASDINNMLLVRVQALTEVRYNLEDRLDEVI